MHATLPRKCKYIFFDHNAPYLSVKLTNSTQNNCTAMLTIASLEVLLIVQKKVSVTHINRIDKCKNKHKSLSQGINETCKNYFEIEKPEK